MDEILPIWVIIYKVLTFGRIQCLRHSYIFSSKGMRLKSPKHMKAFFCFATILWQVNHSEIGKRKDAFARAKWLDKTNDFYMADVLLISLTLITQF